MQSGGTGQHVQAAASCALSPFGYFHMDILEKHKYFFFSFLRALKMILIFMRLLVSLLTIIDTHLCEGGVPSVRILLLPAEDFMTMATMGLIEYQ